MSQFLNAEHLYRLSYNFIGHVIGCHPKINLKSIASILRNRSGIFATVLIDLIKLSVCVFIDGGSPNPCTWDALLQPSFAKKRSSCKIQTAFRHNNDASTKLQSVNMFYSFQVGELIRFLIFFTELEFISFVPFALFTFTRMNVANEPQVFSTSPMCRRIESAVLINVDSYTLVLWTALKVDKSARK